MPRTALLLLVPVLALFAACTSDDEPAATPTVEATPSATPEATSTATPRPVRTPTPPATPTSAPTPTPIPEHLRVSGLFTEPRAREPDLVRELGPRPPPAFEVTDSTGTVLYDTVLGTERDLGPGRAGTFSPDGRWMGWAADLWDEGDAMVLDIASGETKSLGPGRSVLFLDDERALVYRHERNACDIVHLETGAVTPVETGTCGQIESEAPLVITPTRGRLRTDEYELVSEPPQWRPWEQQRISAVRRDSGEPVLVFDALNALFASASELLVTTRGEADWVNVFLVDIGSRSAEFIASSPQHGTPEQDAIVMSLAASERYLMWSNDICAESTDASAGSTSLYDRATGTLTEVGTPLFATFTLDGRIAVGDQGVTELIDPDSLEYIIAIDDFGVTWSPDYRYASSGVYPFRDGYCFGFAN